MAKGDSGRAQGMINDQRQMTQPFQNQVNQTMWNSNNMGYQLANEGNVRALGDYDSIMQGYRDFAAGQGAGAGGGGGVGLDPYYSGWLNKSLEGYGDFSKTGGFSDQNLQDIRARAIAPTRAIYANAQDNIRRQRALQGGYSPNYTAASTKLARNLSQEIGDRGIDAEAGIAQMVQQGKLAGLGGMQSGAGMGMNAALQAAMANSSAGSAARGQNLAALNAMQNMYEATPGLAALYGNLSLGHERNLLAASGQNNELGLGLINAQNQKGQIPGDFAQAMGNVGSLLGGAGGLFTGIGALGKV